MAVSFNAGHPLHPNYGKGRSRSAQQRRRRRKEKNIALGLLAYRKRIAWLTSPEYRRFTNQGDKRIRQDKIDKKRALKARERDFVTRFNRGEFKPSFE